MFSPLDQFDPLINVEPPFYAIYFNMGMYNADDDVPKEILGFDCPFDDSDVIQTQTPGELIGAVREAYFGRHPGE
tara:strand:+ start:7750 stop:7974 length:225 start_codon:yes stop_codon:yes gene_type:complete